MRLLASSCLSVRMELGSHWMVIKFDMSIFRKSAENTQVSLKSGKSNEYFTWRPTYSRISLYIS